MPHLTDHQSPITNRSYADALEHDRFRSEIRCGRAAGQPPGMRTRRLQRAGVASRPPFLFGTCEIRQREAEQSLALPERQDDRVGIPVFQILAERTIAPGAATVLLPRHNFGASHGLAVRDLWALPDPIEHSCHPS